MEKLYKTRGFSKILAAMIHSLFISRIFDIRSLYKIYNICNINFIHVIYKDENQKFPGKFSILKKNYPIYMMFV